MGERRNGPDAWLDTATAGVRFGPDRAAVRGELEAHLEDKAADLQRIFPELTAEEARVRALEQMGDAAEIGRELAKIHRPWLGWLWRASKWTAAALVLGNSSSGVVETPTFGVPAVNVGGRQEGRPVCKNVLCCPAEKKAIAAAVRKALSPEFAAVAKGAKSPYNGGDTSGRIVDILLDAVRRPDFGAPKVFYDGK